MADYVVSTVFKGENQLTNVFSQMSRESETFGRGLGGVFDRASKNALSFKTVLGGVLGALGISRIMGMVFNGIRETTTELLSFDDAITAAAAKFGGLARGTEIFNQLKTTARETGKVTEFTATQAAQGLRFLAKAGYEPAFAMKALRTFVDLATGSEVEFARATDISTDVVGAFRLNVGTAEEKLAGLVRANDVMVKAVNSANIDLEDFFEVVKMAGPIATDAGISIEKFAAITAYMGGAGIKGSLGGTALRTAILALTAPTGAAHNKFRELGITLEDARHNMRDPIEIFHELADKIDKMGSAQRTATLAVLFGKRAISGASVSIEGATGALQKFDESMQNAGGASKSLAELMRQSISKRLDTLISSAQEVALKFIDVFGDSIPDAIDSLNDKINAFDMKPIQDALKGVVKFTERMIDITKTLSELILPLAAGFVAYKIAILFFTTAEAFHAVGFMWAMRHAIRAAWVEMLLFNATLWANPITWIAIGIGVAVAALVLLVTHWDEFWKTWKEGIKVIGEFLYEWIVEPLKKAMEWMHYFNPIRRFFGKEDAASRDYENKKITAEEDALKKKYEGEEAARARAADPGNDSDEYASRDLLQSIEPDVQMSVANRDINFRGRIDINGAPAGSAAESTTDGAPPITMSLGDQ